MKIKHFSGYGSVTAKKVFTRAGVNERGEQHKLLVIDVTGDHERGLVPYIESDAAAWLLKYFDKAAADNVTPWNCETVHTYNDDGVTFYISYVTK